MPSAKLVRFIGSPRFILALFNCLTVYIDKLGVLSLLLLSESTWLSSGTLEAYSLNYRGVNSVAHSTIDWRVTNAYAIEDVVFHPQLSVRYGVTNSCRYRHRWSILVSFLFRQSGEYHSRLCVKLFSDRTIALCSDYSFM